MSENTALRKILGPKTEKARGDWRKLYNGELHDLTSPSNIIWVIKHKMGWEVHVARVGKRRCAYRVSGRKKPKGKRPLERSRRVWKNNIKINP